MKFIKEMWRPTLLVVLLMLLFIALIYRFQPKQDMLSEKVFLPEIPTEVELEVEEEPIEEEDDYEEPIPEPETSLESTYNIPSVDRDFELHLASIMMDFNINLDIAYIYATIYCESNFRSNAKSPSGALGYMQVLPSTRDFIQGLIKKEFPQYSQLSSDLYDPKTNVVYGLYYFRYIAECFGESEVNGTNVSKILTCYNRGVAGGKSFCNSTGSWNSSYSNKIINLAEQIMTNGGV